MKIVIEEVLESPRVFHHQDQMQSKCLSSSSQMTENKLLNFKTAQMNQNQIFEKEMKIK